MRRILLGIVAIGVLSAPPALATDMAVKAPPPVPAPAPIFSWTGFYIGGNAGGAWERESNSLVVTNNLFFAAGAIPGINASGSQTLHSSGFSGGGQVGYNYQSGNVVWGIELDFESLSQGASGGGPFAYTTNGVIYQLTTNSSTNWLFTARPRLGWAIDRNLLYVTGGVAVVHRRFTQNFLDIGGGPETASFSKAQAGWTVGAGYEYAVTNNWTLRAEYLFAGFDAVTASGLEGPAGGTSTLNNSSKLDVQIVRGGLNYKFGG
mgnify:CR=1 FL=1